MKLSDAILLGSTIVMPSMGGRKNCGIKQGCALDMALEAVGSSFHWQHADKIWPWLSGRDSFRREHLLAVAVVFDAYFGQYGYGVPPQLTGEFSLETFVAWIRTIEPADPIKPTTQHSEEYSYARS